MATYVRGAKGNSRPRKRKDERAHINRNLLNYPLARDARVILADWRRGKKMRDWRHRLPGDDRIDLRFTADADAKLRRCPTGFDINVLFCLLREAQNEGKVSIASRSALLGKLGLGRDSANRRRLNRSLSYWSAVTIRNGSWREAREPWSERGRNVAKLLPSPIQAMSGTRKLSISISNEWRAIASRYFERVPLPLPTHAAAQNLVLCLLTSHQRLDLIADQDDPKFLYRRRVGKLCQKIGVTHRHWSSALTVAKAWFENHGYELQEVIKDNLVVFTLDRPDKRAKRLARFAARRPIDRVAEAAEPKKKIERVRLNKPRAEKIDTTGMHMQLLSDGRRGFEATDEEGTRLWIGEYGEVIGFR